MRSFRAGIAALVLVMPLTYGRAVADDKPGSADASKQFDAIVKDYNSRRAKAAKAFAAASNEQEKARALAEQPKAQEYAERVTALVDKHRFEPFAANALAWVYQHSDPGPTAQHALNLLFADHMDSDEWLPIVSRLVYSNSPDIEKDLNTLLNHNPHRTVQAMTCIGLARYYKMEPEKWRTPNVGYVKYCNEKAENFLQMTLRAYSDVQYQGESIKNAVARELYEIHNLSIGKAAPEITGQDIHGKPFKLSDYRGKVVMLDFWGHW
jgi:hypothetical protein